MSQQQQPLHRQRGWRARLRRALRGNSPSAATPEYPFRLRPSTISISERYDYVLPSAAMPTSIPVLERSVGEIQIDLPFDQFTSEAFADAARATSAESGAIDGRYGWLGFSHLQHTDIPKRFASVRFWPSATQNAFRLSLPILDAQTDSLIERVEAGWHEQETLIYIPAPPDIKQPPFRFEMFVSRDSAVPTLPRPRHANTEHQLSVPTPLTSKEMALHVHLTLILPLSPAVTLDAAQDKIYLEDLQLDWPTPLVVNQFELRGLPAEHLTIDASQNQLIIQEALIPLISVHEGVWHGELSFALVIRQPTLLDALSDVTGQFKIRLEGLTLSGMRAYYFDTTGYLRERNQADESLISAQSELIGRFSYALRTLLAQAPQLFERRYHWFSRNRPAVLFHNIEQLLQAHHFEIDSQLSYDIQNQTRRWASLEIEGHALILDLLLTQQDVVTPAQEEEETADALLNTTDALSLSSLPFYTYELKLRGYYRGKWEVVAETFQTFEADVRERLHIRRGKGL